MNLKNETAALVRVEDCELHVADDEMRVTFRISLDDQETRSQRTRRHRPMSNPVLDNSSRLVPPRPVKSKT